MTEHSREEDGMGDLEFERSAKRHCAFGNEDNTAVDGYSPAPVSNGTPAPVHTESNVHLDPARAQILKEKLAKALKVFEHDPSQTESKGALFHCDYCKKDITNVLRIRCAVCSDFDLCLDCFSVGVEIRDHRADHNYHLMEPNIFPIITREWTADEELALIEGVEVLGFGNWEGIADMVGTKSKQKCRKHYLAHYIDCPTYPLPKFGENLQPVDGMELELSDDEPDVDHKPSKTDPKVLPPNPTPLDLAGYMPKRGDYSTEFENEAELILADLTFGADDTPEDRLLKLRVLDIYNSKLDQRTRRKKFARERGLLDIKKLQAKERKMLKEDRNLVQKLRPFARHQSAQENDTLVNGLLEEQRLRRHILQLKEWRLHGVRTLAEGEIYEAGKKRRLEQKMTQKSGGKGNIGTPVFQRSVSRSGRPVTVTIKGEPVTPKTDEPKRPRKQVMDAATLAQELLGDREKLLCGALKLTAQQYLYIKNTLIMESLRQGHLKKANIRNLVKIDVNKAGKIFDFFVECKWINTDPEVKMTTLPELPAPTPPANTQGDNTSTSTSTSSTTAATVTATASSTSATTPATAATTSATASNVNAVPAGNHTPSSTTVAASTVSAPTTHSTNTTANAEQQQQQQQQAATEAPASNAPPPAAAPPPPLARAAPPPPPVMTAPPPFIKAEPPVVS